MLDLPRVVGDVKRQNLPYFGMFANDISSSLPNTLGPRCLRCQWCVFMPCVYLHHRMPTDADLMFELATVMSSRSKIHEPPCVTDDASRGH